MAYKVLAFKGEARQKLFEGVTLLADAVVTTLSPKGRNVAIHRNWGMPIVVHDGVTVAREVESQDPLVKIGIDLVREAASKTNEEAGDGTTTATLLAYEIIKNGLKMIEDGANPMVLRKEIYDQLPKLLEELKKLSTEVKTKEEIANVAFISSADKEIGDLVADAVERVGNDGLVTCEEGSGLSHEVEFTDGLQFNKGWASPYFVTNPARMEAVVDKPVYAIIPGSITSNPEIVPMLESMVKVSKNIVVIAEEIKGDALATLAMNKAKGVINACAVNAPGVGDKSAYLEDIAILTGGKVLAKQSGINVTANQDWVGSSDKFVSSKETSVIIGGKGNKQAIDKRIADIKEQISKEKSSYEKEKLEDRLARLTTGVAVIKVGFKTETDLREKVERVKDAIGSATAARDEGIIVGGGSVFLQLSKVLGEATGGERLLKAILQAPAKKIMENSGETEASTAEMLKTISADKTATLGYNCGSGAIENLREKGIIDPAKVVRLALENAISVGTSILTTDCTIAIQLEEADRKPQ